MDKKTRAPIHERTQQDLEKKRLKIEAIQKQMELDRLESERLELEEIERLQIHKPGQKLDVARFESNYKDQIEKWAKNRTQTKSLEPEEAKPRLISKLSEKIVNSNFQNLGNKHAITTNESKLAKQATDNQSSKEKAIQLPKKTPLTPILKK